MENFAFGCNESRYDRKRVYHEELLTMADPNVATNGGYDYLPDEIEHQHKVGICTAISLTQNARKAIGRKFSADFQYLLQKKYIDGNWYEGSAILSALKVGQKYGFLPLENWTWTTEEDRFLSYDAYIAKLKAVPDAEIVRLMKLCADYKLSGYAQIAYQDPQAISKAILASRSGILCMYVVDEQWWSPSWNPKDINPLRAPKTNLSGHAVGLSRFDYREGFWHKLVNSWGKLWNMFGLADINWTTYKMREAWIPYYGMTEVQTQELKKNLESKISLLQRLVELYTALFRIQKK